MVVARWAVHALDVSALHDGAGAVAADRIESRGAQAITCHRQDPAVGPRGLSGLPHGAPLTICSRRRSPRPPRRSVRLWAFVSALAITGLLGVSCSTTSQPSFDDIAQTLDDYPLPSFFRFEKEGSYTFNAGPHGQTANTVIRLYTVDRSPEEVYAATLATLSSNNIRISPGSAPGKVYGRISTLFRGFSVIVFTGKTPVEVLIYTL